MVQILQAPQKRDYAKELMGTFERGVDKYQGMQAQKAENKKLAEMGLDVEGLTPEYKKMLFENEMQKQLEREKLGGKLKEGEAKQQELKGAVDIVNKMRDLRKKGNLGFNLTGRMFPSVRRDKGEYEQLGKSLIQYATNIPIRNKLEFETLAEKIYDPDITDAEAEGILNAMERIIQSSMGKEGGEGEKGAAQKPKKDLKSFYK